MQQIVKLYFPMIIYHSPIMTSILFKIFLRVQKEKAKKIISITF